MVGIIEKVSGIFGFWSGHQRLIERVQKLEEDRKAYDTRIENLTRATMDGDENWFLQVVKNDPTCALKVIEECEKPNARKLPV
jgi:hypothetical protein